MLGHGENTATKRREENMWRWGSGQEVAGGYNPTANPYWGISQQLLGQTQGSSGVTQSQPGLVQNLAQMGGQALGNYMFNRPGVPPAPNTGPAPGVMAQNPGTAYFMNQGNYGQWD